MNRHFTCRRHVGTAPAARYAAAMNQPQDPIELSRLTRRMAMLRQEHRDLDSVIERLATDIQADELALKRLKKRKLWLKDCISRLESALIPDEPA